MQSTEINVTLFPPMGAGVTAQGQIVPSLTYPNVRDLERTENWPIAFTTRSGDRITTTLPYIIQEVAPAKSIHEN